MIDDRREATLGTFQAIPLTKNIDGRLRNRTALLDNRGTIALKRLIKAAGTIRHDAWLVSGFDSATMRKNKEKELLIN